MTSVRVEGLINTRSGRVNGCRRCVVRGKWSVGHFAHNFPTLGRSWQNGCRTQTRKTALRFRGSFKGGYDFTGGSQILVQLMVCHKIVLETFILKRRNQQWIILKWVNFKCDSLVYEISPFKKKTRKFVKSSKNLPLTKRSQSCKYIIKYSQYRQITFPLPWCKSWCDKRQTSR